MTCFVDLSHELGTGMPVYPGDPEVGLVPSAQDEPWRVLSLSLGSHSGTHIDAARHYVPGGRTIDEYPIERFVVAAVVARVHGGEDEEIGPAALDDALTRWQVAWAIFPPSEPIVAVIDREPGWRRLYADKFAVVQVREDAPGAEGLRQGN